MLRINANARISLKEAQNHYWVQENYPEALRQQQYRRMYLAKSNDESPLMKYITGPQMQLFMKMRPTPNAAELFNISPERVRARRRSTAVWPTTVLSFPR